MKRSDRQDKHGPRGSWQAGARRGLVLLVAAACFVHLAGCVRVSVRTRPPEGDSPAYIPAAEAPAAKEAPQTASGPALLASGTTQGQATPAQEPTDTVTPRQAAFLVTRTPLPKPTPSPTPTIPPPTPAIPRALTPPSELAIPSINLKAPVVPIGWHEVEPGGETVWDDPGAAAGWLDSSALPGEGSNAVLVGHHNVRGEVFRYLVDVTPGDEVYLTAGNITYRYLVRERFIIPEKHVSAEQKEQNALWIAPTIDERLTMVTCWPYRDNTHRLIVIAAPAPIESAP